MDVDGTVDETCEKRTAKSCGSDASTLAFKLAEVIPLATVTTKPDHRGDHDISRKPLRGGCRVFPV